MAAQPIPPYTEADERAAREAFQQWRDRLVGSRVGNDELDDLVREVAGAIATARAEGHRETIAELERRDQLNAATALRDAFGDSL